MVSARARRRGEERAERKSQIRRRGAMGEKRDFERTYPRRWIQPSQVVHVTPPQSTPTSSASRTPFAQCASAQLPRPSHEVPLSSRHGVPTAEASTLQLPSTHQKERHPVSTPHTLTTDAAVQGVPEDAPAPLAPATDSPTESPPIPAFPPPPALWASATPSGTGGRSSEITRTHPECSHNAATAARKPSGQERTGG